MSCSEEESDISESEIEEYKDKPYEQLKSGELKVAVNGTLRCPFCPGKRKRDYKYNELIQHASGASKGSANKNARFKASHRALEIYLQNDLSNAPKPPSSTPKPPSNQPAINTEKFVWPWTGIAAVKPRDSRERDTMRDRHFWLESFAKYKPSETLVFWDSEGGSISAALRFNSGWNGFINATDFEKSFEASNLNKRKCQEQGKLGAIYGWCAREDDFNGRDLIGEYLRETGRLRSVSEFSEEEAKNKKMAVSSLTSKIEETNANLNELETSYNRTTHSLSVMLEEKNKLHDAYVSETRMLQRIARENVKRILDEKDSISEQLEAKKKKLDLWRMELDKREALTEREKQKREEEKKQHDASNSSLKLASMEQKKSDENLLRLIEEQKAEKQEALNKIILLEKKVDAKQKLEMEIEKLKGKLEVTKHLGGKDDEGLQKKMNEMMEELKEKESDLEAVEALNSELVKKERQSNDELVEARKELIKGLPEIIDGDDTEIGIKRMAELNGGPFVEICRKKFSNEEADLKAMELCSVWQDKVIDSNWYPFKVISSNGVSKAILDEGDEELMGLKREWGDEVYCAVVKALNESVEFNPSGRYVVSELWNFKEDRVATLKEVGAFIYRKMKVLKEKRGKKKGVVRQ